MDYYQLLVQKNINHPTDIFIQIDNESYTYRQIKQQSDTLFQQIKFTGLKSGSRLLISSQNFYQQVISFFAVQAAGYIPILLHKGLSSSEIQGIINKNHLQGILQFGSKGLEKNFLIFDNIIPKIDCCLGVLSSGSSGLPKVMYRTYASWADFFPIQNIIFKIKKNSRVFLQGSLSFTGNLNTFLSVLYEGGQIITSNFIHCRSWLQLISDSKVSVLYLVPSKLRLLLQVCKKEIVTVNLIFTGSQLLDKKDLYNLHQYFTNAQIILYYGASELNYITYAECRSLDRDSRNLGRPFPGVEIYTKNNIIYVNTKYHVTGLKMPYTVNDLGYINKNGELIFQGRRQNWINKGGFKISCIKIQLNLRKIFGVKDAVVLPYKDSLRGAELAAFIIPRKNINKNHIRQYIQKNFNPVEVPGKIYFLEKIPLNDRGKLDKSILQSMIL
ncbi:AMP-binding protein [Pectinatus frisingensis]|jgi:acyl-coenzyme A synthetase/AMP-(fatty) acid ligase|uniref:AMP-binding protein n=1 Tax=Pectinatus frisingensis TaxID=865 RepID=UPI0015F566ED|nr:AMP-binding protein [Pectinatus frisingensis]